MFVSVLTSSLSLSNLFLVSLHLFIYVIKKTHPFDFSRSHDFISKKDSVTLMRHRAECRTDDRNLC